MSKFQKSSQHLVDILMSNRFIDITAKYDDKHAQRLIENEGKYEPDWMKRYFIPEGRSKNYMIKLDYINIYLLSPHGHMIDCKEITHNELRGLIAFMILSNADQQQLSGWIPKEIPELINKTKFAIKEGFKSGVGHNKASNRRLLENWDKVIV